MKDDHQNEKKVAGDSSLKKRPVIQDSDLQIHTPAIHTRPPKNSFKAIHTHFDPKQPGFGQEELNLAMEEAKHAFDSMKEIQDQLSRAYIDLIKRDPPK